MKSETIVLGSRTFRVPYADLLRPLSEDEYRALVQSITERGIVSPIVVTEDGVVIDGYHRLRAALDLGLAPSSVPVVVVPYLDDAERLALAVMLNAGRRQLQQEDLRRLVVTLRRSSRFSYRRIAEIVGIAPMTAFRWCREAGFEDEPEKVIGRDGKEYPAEREGTGERDREIWALAQAGHPPQEIADRLGVSLKAVLATLARGQVVLTTAQRSGLVGEALEQGALPPSRVARDTDVVGAFRRSAQRGVTERGEATGATTVLVGDPVRHLGSLPPETVDLALVEATSEEIVRLLEPVAAQLARVVHDGGSVLVATSPAHLPDVLAAVSRHLRYTWLLAARAHTMSYPGFGIAGEYVPIVWFSRGRAVVPEALSDVFDWRRQGWRYLVGKLTRPGMAVALVARSLDQQSFTAIASGRTALLLVMDEGVKGMSGS